MIYEIPKELIYFERFSQMNYLRLFLLMLQQKLIYLFGCLLLTWTQPPSYSYE